MKLNFQQLTFLFSIKIIASLDQRHQLQSTRNRKSQGKEQPIETKTFNLEHLRSQNGGTHHRHPSLRRSSERIPRHRKTHHGSHLGISPPPEIGPTSRQPPMDRSRPRNRAQTLQCRMHPSPEHNSQPILRSPQRHRGQRCLHHHNERLINRRRIRH